MREGEAHLLQSRYSQPLPLHMRWGQKNIATRPCAWQRVIRIAQCCFSSPDAPSCAKSQDVLARGATCSAGCWSRALAAPALDSPCLRMLYLPSLILPSVCASQASKEGTACLRSEEHTLNSSHITISYAVFCL